MAEASPDKQLESLLIDGGAPGVWGFSAPFEAALRGVDAALSALGDEPDAEYGYFPPVLSKSVLERSGYLDSFPHLLGTIHAFHGDEDQWREELEKDSDEDWTTRQTSTDVVLVPAACYHIYPQWTGQLPQGGRSFIAHAYCFRCEATSEVGRFKSFRIREFVRASSPEDCLAWRNAWVERGSAFLAELGLDVAVEAAADPFFGRGHRLMAATQVNEGLKFELQVPLSSDGRSAVASMNYHRDHFGEHFEIKTGAGTNAHTACVGFGLERVTLALARRHGIAVDAWPRSIKDALCL